ncbi:MAG: hypothetical protein ABII26_12215 [Pseudomonadota bacterium]
MEGKGNYKELRITGTIFPARLDDKGNPTRLVIDTTDQDEYFIDSNKKGKELFDHMHQRVELTGTVREDEDGNYIINVRDYYLISEDENKKTYA